ncbi:endoglucanase E-4 precursor [Saccharicrinis fermentans DSM 9555 = JCM 21142]|uniref:Endoglucanase E-4 n=1 Tax=Saccharicrinis fermentans DSM 9555 = JCM 21142 TaxID=869213 RepID=W7YM19_9BACT|nr:endoglucanase E-4 precursor [Saccharicrinis fermentans DSM 9555 = JCM 21142]
MKQSFILIAFLICCTFSNSLVAQHNYGEVLQKSMFFYEAQQAGELSPNNRVTWRANAAIEDGSDVNLDLTGGWFDAGDHVKFNFPMAYSVTTLCWGYLENKDVYASTNQKEIFLENIKHVTDYLIKCHTAPNELYGQIGDGAKTIAIGCLPR